MHLVKQNLHSVSPLEHHQYKETHLKVWNSQFKWKSLSKFIECHDYINAKVVEIDFILYCQSKLWFDFSFFSYWSISWDVFFRCFIILECLLLFRWISYWIFPFNLILHTSHGKIFRVSSCEYASLTSHSIGWYFTTVPSIYAKEGSCNIEFSYQSLTYLIISSLCVLTHDGLLTLNYFYSRIVNFFVPVLRIVGGI